MGKNINYYVKCIFDIFIVIITVFKSQLSSIFAPLRISFESNKNKKCVILGNGPSLKTDIGNLEYADENRDLYVVNYFARSEFFFELKPSHYFFSDKMFWSDEILDKVKVDNESVFDILRSVQWRIVVYCPREGFKFITDKFKTNDNIIIKIIPVRYSNLLLEKSLHKAVKYRLYSVPNVNSVITLLWMTTFMEYDKIILYGCDFSAFKDLRVNQKTNDVVVSTKHFYGNSLAESDASKKYYNQVNKTLSTRLYQVYRGFKLLDILSEVALELKVEVINGSSFSYIDSFPRLQR